MRFVTHRHQAKASPEEKSDNRLIRTPSCGVFSRNPHEGVRIKRLDKRLT